MNQPQPGPRAASARHTALLLVDGDNLHLTFRERNLTVYLDDMIRRMKRSPRLPSDVRPTRVCVFMNAALASEEDYSRKPGLRFGEHSRFCYHYYDQDVGGPRDTEMVQEAWRQREQMNVIAFMSYDTDFARYARLIRSGMWLPGSSADQTLAHRTFLFGEKPPGTAWRSKLRLPPTMEWENYARPWYPISSLLSSTQAKVGR
jgi:hypothetical protein